MTAAPREWTPLTTMQKGLAGAALLCALAGLATGAVAIGALLAIGATGLFLTLDLGGVRPKAFDAAFDPVADIVLAAVTVLTAWLLLASLGENGAPVGAWLLTAAFWLMAWLLIERRAGGAVSRIDRLLIPVVFGLTLLALWEIITRAGQVPPVILPPPSAIGAQFAASTGVLWADFQQTFLKSVLIGYAMGCGSGFLVAVAIDRSPFLKRGLLPVGNLVSALPIIGVAPIMVMWFGFDWHSKAAVVVIMTFFPMLVNTVAGLTAADAMQKDLMRTYAASYGQTLLKLRLPAAAPFIFNALKINSTLALIGAIVAEFFGTPTVGMGFRISTEVGRLALDMVWAEIAVAAITGSAFYAAVALIERAVTFWHPSVRG